jgi:putative peptidoglycan lipid II flippase
LPAKSASISVAVNIVLNLTLRWFLGTGGLAASTALCSYLQVVILAVALRRRLGGAVTEGFVPALWKTTAATLLMSAAVLVALGFSRGLPNIIKLLLAVPAGTIAYLLTAKYLRIEMLSLLTGTKPAAAGVDLQ